ncbi:MAG TPA: GNAT family N-acetyltransferase [Thermoleophilaceae bacterium]|nr:GNAT family N-acetyltransferase [Thermoleophilaceae bacterium]
MPAIPLPSPPLTDGHISLRPWERRDAPAVTAACQDPEIPRWTVVPHSYTERHAREFISGTAVDLANGRELALAVVDAEDRLLGALGISNFDWGDLKAEIGYWIAADARRRGVGTKATRMLAVWALTRLGLERIELLANPQNEPSLRLAERAGFTREGMLRRYRRRHGVPEDLVMFSLLAEDLPDGARPA